MFLAMYPSNFSTFWTYNFMHTFHVLRTILLSRKTGRAYSTWEWLFSSVRALMSLKVDPFLQHLSTEAALELGLLMRQ